MTDMDEITEAHLRASADHLRAVLEAIDSGELEATGRQRAFIAGAALATELIPGPNPGLSPLKHLAQP